MEQFGQRSVPDLDDDMDMVRHHAPCEHAVTLAVEMEQVLFDDLCDTWTAQMTSPVAKVETPLYLALLLRLVFQPGVACPLMPPFRRQRVGPTLGDGLPHTGRIEVRQIAAGTPAFESEREFLRRRWVVPAALVFEEFFERALHGSTGCSVRWGSRSDRTGRPPSLLR